MPSIWTTDLKYFNAFMHCGLNDIVGSAYYAAPEVLHRSYSLEADIWSIGVITYILLCGSRPFWARSESGIFRSVLRSDPNFNDLPWPSVSPEAKDFVKRLLNKDYRKRMTAVQALNATPFKRAAQKALSKALTEDELVYLRAQFTLLEQNRDGSVSLENFKMVREFGGSSGREGEGTPHGMRLPGLLENPVMRASGDAPSSGIIYSDDFQLRCFPPTTPYPPIFLKQVSSNVPPSFRCRIICGEEAISPTRQMGNLTIIHAYASII
ncbi:rho GTPase-activating protein 3-like [Hibiscus syriacus]|uniref:Rho GTPase-activating protein 3-like n=1 Tax=Hibiscus syriacus TaxID=106335 RepID=A0A6A2YQB8_HIBSY|nr:rho GTPase-activating protein 3-like [Hibiscus syriacus]